MGQSPAQLSKLLIALEREFKLAESLVTQEFNLYFSLGTENQYNLLRTEVTLFGVRKITLQIQQVRKPNTVSEV